MENLDLILLISIVIPLLMVLCVTSGKARASVLFLLFGIAGCFLCGKISGLIFRSTAVPLRIFTVNVTPVIEELMKAYPLFIYAFFYKPGRVELEERAVILGAGFAILENAYMLASGAGSVSITFALIRGFGAGMMHCVCTLLVGYGIGLIYAHRKLFITGSLAMMALAISFHSIYNDLAQSSLDLAAFIMPTAAFIPLLLVLKGVDPLALLRGKGENKLK